MAANKIKSRLITLTTTIIDTDFILYFGRFYFSFIAYYYYMNIFYWKTWQSLCKAAVFFNDLQFITS
jgi:hypothetical protein